MPDKLRTYLTQNAKPLPGWDAFKTKMMAMTAKTRLTPALLQSQHNGDPEFVCRIIATELVHKLPFADLERIFAFSQTSLVDENEVATILFEARLNPIGDGQSVAGQDRFSAVKYEPEVVSHPGATLADKIDEMQISTTTFSERSGLSVKMLWDLMHGKESITEEIAEALELVTSIPTAFWLARQARYDEYVAKVAEAQKHKD